MSYESPAITELGSVAQFTRADQLAINYDGQIFHKSTGGGSGPTS